jgi:hypothetical protein
VLKNKLIKWLGGISIEEATQLNKRNLVLYEANKSLMNINKKKRNLIRKLTKEKKALLQEIIRLNELLSYEP